MRWRLQYNTVVSQMQLLYYSVYCCLHGQPVEAPLPSALNACIGSSCTVPTHTASPVFCASDWHKFKRLLASKTFAAHDTQRIPGDALTAEWAEESGFREPVIIPDKTGMGLKVPRTGLR